MKNTKAIIAAARQRTADREQRARAAIKRLIAADKPIDFAQVAQAAQVGKSFLYSHPALRQEIARLREANGGERIRPVDEQITRRSEQTVVHVLRGEVARLNQEVGALKQRLERNFGQLSAEQLRTATAQQELEDLRRHLAALQRDSLPATQD